MNFLKKSLTSTGLGADNVLEWEVVLANGEIVTASRFENEDLYWYVDCPPLLNAKVGTFLNNNFEGACLTFDVSVVFASQFNC